MGNEENRKIRFVQKFLQPGNSLKIQMIGGLIQNQHMGFPDQCPGKKCPAFIPTGKRFKGMFLSQSYPVNDRGDLMIEAPSVSLIQFRL